MVYTRGGRSAVALGPTDACAAHRAPPARTRRPSARTRGQGPHRVAETVPERTRWMCVHLATPVRARRRSLSDSFRGGGCAPGPASTISSCPSPCMHRAPALTAVSEFQHGELLRARRGAESHAGAPRAATEGARHVRSRRGCTAQGPRRPKGVAPAAGEWVHATPSANEVG